MASPFPFTAGQVLTAAQLNSIGETTAFTPSWNNFTVGNAVESWYYTQINDLVIVQGETELGSTSSVTGTWTMDYPISSPAPSAISAGEAYFIGGTNSLGFVQLGASALIFRPFDVSGSTVFWTQADATTPFSWTTGDRLRASIVYMI